MRFANGRLLVVADDNVYASCLGGPHAKRSVHGRESSNPRAAIAAGRGFGQPVRKVRPMADWSVVLKSRVDTRGELALYCLGDGNGGWTLRPRRTLGRGWNGPRVPGASHSAGQ